MRTFRFSLASDCHDSVSSLGISDNLEEQPPAWIAGAEVPVAVSYSYRSMWLNMKISALLMVHEADIARTKSVFSGFRSLNIRIHVR